MPFCCKHFVLEEQVRLAKEKKNQQWLKQATELGYGVESGFAVTSTTLDPGEVRDREIERINELYTTGGTQDWREEDTQVSDAQDSTLKEKSPSITLEEEERLLASSPDVYPCGGGF